MRKLLVLLWILLCPVTVATAQVSFGIEAPGVSIGINFPVYPQLVQVPGYPVYYAPQVNSNYFFYDGMYWVYQQDNWYASSWYNGPWALVSPEAVPYFILRVPVRYYRRPPTYFHGWSTSAPPRWGEHWGNTWAQSRQGWDRWDRASVPAPAPLPVYQRQYSGNKYPRAEEQHVIQSQSYRYQPHEAVVQQHYQAQQVQSPPASEGGRQPQAVPPPKAPQQQQAAPQQKAPQQREGATQQKAQQQQQQQQAATQQKAQQQQQREAASQQKAQQQQAQTQQKAQQQQQREAASQQKAQQQKTQQQQAQTQQKAQQQQQREAASQQKAQQQQRQPQQQGAAQQREQQPQQATAQHEQKGQKQAPEKGEQPGGERTK